MKHIITPTATSNAEKKQYLNANGWSERLVADNWINNADFTPANLSGVNDKRPSMYVKPFTPVLLVGVSFKSPFSNHFSVSSLFIFAKVSSTCTSEV